MVEASSFAPTAMTAAGFVSGSARGYALPRIRSIQFMLSSIQKGAPAGTPFDYFQYQIESY